VGGAKGEELGASSVLAKLGEAPFNLPDSARRDEQAGRC
jgi:hypothetical protein